MHAQCPSIMMRAVTGRIELTLGLSELALLNTGLDSLVELGIESALRRKGNLVVGRHILLDGLATAMGRVVSIWLR